MINYSENRQSIRLLAITTAVILGLGTVPAYAVVGDVIAQHNVDGVNGLSAAGNFCSIGLAFDGTTLYLDQCGDRDLIPIDPVTGLAGGAPFDWAGPAGQFPNAMAFDMKRNGLWIGSQACTDEDGVGGLNDHAIYFHDFGTGVTTNEFDILGSLINPATGVSFVAVCFVDGLAYNENDPTTAADDEIWFSDDVSTNVGLFRPDGTLVMGYDGSTIDPSLSSGSGLAIGGADLYMGNDGGGDVFRADAATFTFISTFASIDDRVEDMECDPDSFSVETMWVRSTPQASPADNIITAYEIAPDTCGIGGQPGNGPTVAGELLPIDSAALMIAGLQSSAIWMLPILAGAVGTGAYIVRSKLK